jgi:sterol desaturase/sphingolipid hydroxylase (fatty acid hydroxylase superfamily)
LHNRWFGVSSPLWDYVFRTHVRPGERVKPDDTSNVDWDRRISGGVPNEG